jgi:hypothetical protein
MLKNLTGSSLGVLGGKTIDELQLGTSTNVICMSTNALAIHAIYLVSSAHDTTRHTLDTHDTC